MISFRFVLLAAALLHQAAGLVIPEVHEDLERRAINCPGGGKSPCVCGGQLGIKVSTNNCPDGKFVFSKPNDPNNGDMVRVAGGRSSDVQCDHLVEAQFVAKEFIDNSPMCNHFLNGGAQGTADFQSFKRVLNTPAGGNFVFLNTEVNRSKGSFIGGGTINGRKKLALGVASYLTKTRSTARSAAQALKTEMDRIATARGFTSFSANFVNDYDALIGRTITAATARAAQLPATAAPPPPKKRPATGPPGTAPPPKKTKVTQPVTAPKTPAARKKTAQAVADARKKAALKQGAASRKKKTP